MKEDVSGERLELVPEPDKKFVGIWGYEVNKSDDGTSVKLQISSIGDVLFNTPIAILSKKAQEMIESDLKRLKKHLEQE